MQFITRKFVKRATKESFTNVEGQRFAIFHEVRRAIFFEDLLLLFQKDAVVDDRSANGIATGFAP